MIKKLGKRRHLSSISSFNTYKSKDGYIVQQSPYSEENKGVTLKYGSKKVTYLSKMQKMSELSQYFSNPTLQTINSHQKVQKFADKGFSKNKSRKQSRQNSKHNNLNSSNNYLRKTGMGGRKTRSKMSKSFYFSKNIHSKVGRKRRQASSIHFTVVDQQQLIQQKFGNCKFQPQNKNLQILSDSEKISKRINLENKRLKSNSSPQCSQKIAKKHNFFFTKNSRGLPRSKQTSIKKARVITLSNQNAKTNINNPYYTGPVKRLYTSLRYPTKSRYSEDPNQDKFDIILADQEALHSTSQGKKELQALKSRRQKYKNEFKAYLDGKSEFNAKESYLVKILLKKELLKR